jgi:hypothetical protein
MGSSAIVISSNQEIPPLVGSLYSATTLTAGNGTTPVVLLTAPAGMYLYLTRVLIEVYPSCTITGGGIISATVSDSTFGVVSALPVYAPATFTNPTQATPATVAETGAGFFWLSGTTATTLSVALSVSLLGGAFRVAVNGGYTSFGAGQPNP